MFHSSSQEIGYIHLINVGVHIGHTIRNSTIFSSWMIVGIRQGLFIIDLYKFLYMMRIGFTIIDHAVRFSGPVWFINLDKASERYVKYTAMVCGEMWVCDYWIRGMLTNYKSIFNSYRKLSNRSELIKSRRDRLFETNYSKWIYTRFTWPRTIFVSNVFKSFLPCKEALSLQIPCLGIIDTNAMANSVTVAIPGNDESIECIIFYNNLVSTFIVFKKFRHLFSWFVSIRSKARLLNFNTWYTTKYGTNAGTVKTVQPSILFRYDHISTIIRGASLFFVQSYWLKNVRERLIFSYGPSQTKIVPTSSILKFFDNFHRNFLALTTYQFFYLISYRLFPEKIVKWLVANQPKSAFNRKTLLRAKNLLQFYGNNGYYIGGLAPRIKSIESVKNQRFISKFISIFLLFSNLRYFSLFSKRFYRKWPRTRFQKQYFNHPSYLSLLKMAKFSGNRVPVYRKLLKRRVKTAFNQVPSNWYLFTNMAYATLLSNYLGMGILLPFCRTSSSPAIHVPTPKGGSGGLLEPWKNLRASHSSVLKKLSNNKSRSGFSIRRLRRLVKLYAKFNNQKKAIGYSQQSNIFRFIIGSWSLVSAVPRYSWSNNGAIFNSVIQTPKVLTVRMGIVGNKSSVNHPVVNFKPSWYIFHHYVNLMNSDSVTPIKIGQKLFYKVFRESPFNNVKIYYKIGFIPGTQIYRTASLTEQKLLEKANIKYISKFTSPSKLTPIYGRRFKRFWTWSGLPIWQVTLGEAINRFKGWNYN